MIEKMMVLSVAFRDSENRTNAPIWDRTGRAQPGPVCGRRRGTVSWTTVPCNAVSSKIFRYNPHEISMVSNYSPDITNSHAILSPMRTRSVSAANIA